MPLNRFALVHGIRIISDERYVGHKWPANIQESAQSFANALNNFTAALIPVTKTHQAAAAIFVNTFVSLVNAKDTTFLTKALDLYCQQLALGMMPEFTSLFPMWTHTELNAMVNSGINGASAEQSANTFTDIITMKFTSPPIMATNNVSGVMVPWS
jgi:hypothetical protein